MKNIYVTFGGAAYDDTIQYTVENAPLLGADEVLVYDEAWLVETPFYKMNRWLWDTPGMKGFGYWCWKPYVIMDALKCLQPGDIVLYTDGDTYPVRDFSVLYAECARTGGTMLFKACGCSNRQWVKRDCFVVLNMDDARWYDTEHAVARFMLFQKGPWHVEQFLMEWLSYCINGAATTFNRSVLRSELDGHTEHRTEQAILSLLAHKYGHKLYREACDFGEPSPEDKDLYPTLFKQVHSTKAKGTVPSRFRNV